MSTQAVQIMTQNEDTAQQIVAPRHLVAYGWIYMIFAVLTALALYVMFTVPQGDI